VSSIEVEGEGMEDSGRAKASERDMERRGEEVTRRVLVAAAFD
jgi:hypothetical protein